MAILPSEIAYYRSETVTNTADNGGRMAAARVVDGVKNNFFPDVTQAGRTAGVTRLRKLFAAVENADNLSLLKAGAHLASCTQGQGWLTIFTATQRQTQGDIPADPAPREYAAAPLHASVEAGAASFVLALEDTSLATCFQDGDTIWLGNTNGGQYFENVSVDVSGSLVTVTLDGTNQLAESHTAGQSFCASVLPVEGGDINATYDAWSANSTGGSYDEENTPLEVDGIGAVEDDWLLTFTSATSFNVTGAYSGDQAAGEISSDYAPSNPDGGVFFTLRAAGFGGTWQAGDSIAFTTHPATMPLWVRHMVPAGAAAVASISANIVLVGESE